MIRQTHCSDNQTRRQLPRVLKLRSALVSVGTRTCAAATERCATGEVFEAADLSVERGDPEWMEVDVCGVRTERTRRFGGPWLGQVLSGQLELDRVLEEPSACAHDTEQRSNGSDTLNFVAG